MLIGMHEPVFFYWSEWGLLFTIFYIIFLFLSKIFNTKNREILKFTSIIFAFSFLILVLTSSGFLAALITFPAGIIINYLVSKFLNLD